MLSISLRFIKSIFHSINYINKTMLNDNYCILISFNIVNEKLLTNFILY